MSVMIYILYITDMHCISTYNIMLIYTYIGPSPQGNAVVYEELPYDTHVTDYSIPVDCIAPPPPVGSRPVREKVDKPTDSTVHTFHS